MPDLADDELWLTVETSDDGSFFGTGFGRNSSGDAVFYVSLADSDRSLEAALQAAQLWAEKHGVPRIWVQSEAQ